MRDLRIIITGDENFYDLRKLKTECLRVIAEELKVVSEDDKIDKDKILIVLGDNVGAETLGMQFAEMFDLRTKTFYKNFVLGTGALPTRNIEMVKYLLKTDKWYHTVLVVFTNGESLTTENTVHWLERLKYKKIICVGS